MLDFTGDVKFRWTIWLARPGVIPILSYTTSGRAMVRREADLVSVESSVVLFAVAAASSNHHFPIRLLQGYPFGPGSGKFMALLRAEGIAAGEDGGHGQVNQRGTGPHDKSEDRFARQRALATNFHFLSQNDNGHAL